MSRGQYLSIEETRKYGQLNAPLHVVDLYLNRIGTDCSMKAYFARVTSPIGPDGFCSEMLWVALASSPEDAEKAIADATEKGSNIALNGDLLDDETTKKIGLRPAIARPLA